MKKLDANVGVKEASNSGRREDDRASQASRIGGMKPRLDACQSRPIATLVNSSNRDGALTAKLSPEAITPPLRAQEGRRKQNGLWLLEWVLTSLWLDAPGSDR